MRKRVPEPERADRTVEIKARCRDLGAARKALLALGARSLGEEAQEDTFYNVPEGRLKLRRSGSENLLIGYRRPDTAGPRHCRVDLHEYSDPESLDRVLAGMLGRRIVVRKRRERLVIGRAKFHLDRVEGLGDFLEIEVLGQRAKDTLRELEEDCSYYMEILEVKDTDLVERAYADLLEDISSGEDSSG